MLRLFLFKFLVITLVCFSNQISSKDLYFAGFSFMGNADQSFRYPVADQLFNDNNLIFKEPLDTALSQLQKDDINLIYDLGTISSGTKWYKSIL